MNLHLLWFLPAFLFMGFGVFLYFQYWAEIIKDWVCDRKTDKLDAEIKCIFIAIHIIIFLVVCTTIVFSYLN